MRKSIFLGIALACAAVCAAPIRAQTNNDSVFRVIAPAPAQKFDQDIALHLRATTFEQALVELQKQSDVPLNLSNLDRKTLDTPLSIDVDTPAFNVAFNAIADEAGLKVQLAKFGDAAPRIVTLKDAQGRFAAPELSPDAPVSTDGLFVTRLKKLEVKRLSSLDWSGNPAPARARDENLNVALDVAHDPRLPVVGPSRVRITRAEDEQGRSLMPPPVAEKAPFYFFSMGNFGDKTTKTVALLPPANDARQLAHLEGVAIYVLSGAREKWEVPVDLNGKFPLTHDFKNGGQDVQISIASVERKGEDLSVKITMSAPNGGDWGALGNPLFSISEALPLMVFEDASGAILRAQSDGGGQEGNKMNAGAIFQMPQNMTLFPRKGVEPAKITLPLKFVFEAPTEFVQTEVPFAFKDVPLP